MRLSVSGYGGRQRLCGIGRLWPPHDPQTCTTARLTIHLFSEGTLLSYRCAAACQTF